MTALTLTTWFQVIDSDRPEGILDLIAADFRFSIVFGTGAGAATDFAGGKQELEGYLRQREKGVLTHRVLSTGVDGRDELVLGDTRRAGTFESTFVAAARLGDDGLVRNLMIGRSPMLELHAPS